MQSTQAPIEPSWTILTTLQWTAGYFKSHHIDSPRLTAEILLAHVLGADRIDLYLKFDQPLSADERARFKSLILRRINREPVAYLTGEKEFFGLGLDVAKDVLIPRPETEFLVEKALDVIPAAGPDGCPPARRILDLGTGSGGVIVALAVHRPGHLFFASDISPNALQLARKNAAKHGAGGIYFFAGDWLAAVDRFKGGFDIILSNPPYIPSAEIDRLEPEIRGHEPRKALDGGPDGLAAVRLILSSAPFYLNKNGMLLLEIGYDQARPVTDLIQQTGFYASWGFVQDYAGHDRVLFAQT
jgi:release factor glutamine methyltransferase